MKNKRMKSLIAIILSIALLLPVLAVPASAEGGIEPYNYNVNDMDATAELESNGYLKINYYLDGIYGKMTVTNVTTYIDKQVLGIFWSRVNIGEPDNEWYDRIFKCSYQWNHSVQLPSSGKYRVTVKFEGNGSGGPADTKTREIIVNY